MNKIILTHEIMHLLCENCSKNEIVALSVIQLLNGCTTT